jgi:hypothetical protein
MSVIGKFRTLIARIAPTASELSKARRHILSIRTRLYKDFNVKKFLQIGSHSRKTAIHQFSDVDYIVVLARDEVRWGENWVSSSTILERIKNSIQARYTSTVIRRDQQAVVIGFGGDNQSVDIVPGFYWRAGPSNYPVYAIPNGSGGWMETAPQLHNKFITTEDSRSRFQLRKTIQLVKFWRYCRTPFVPLSSFHLELLISSKGICIGAKTYAECLYRIFQILSSRQCRPLRDPLGISGNISGAYTDGQREYSTKETDYAYDHVHRALYAEQQRNIKEVYRQWNIVFNGYFPK